MHPFLTTYDINIQELGKESVRKLVAIQKMKILSLRKYYSLPSH
ncbi:MAG: hypothetical protein ACLTZN_05785 [Streptococcus sp.]